MSGYFPHNFIGRLRQAQLLPRPAGNNVGSRKIVASQVEHRQARHAGCSSCSAYARTIVRSKFVATEAEFGQAREMNEDTAEVGRARGLKVCVAEVEARQGREVRQGGKQQPSS